MQWGMKKQENKVNQYDWHEWFAWFPVRASHFIGDTEFYVWCWLEVVIRRKSAVFGTIEPEMYDECEYVLRAKS